MRVRRACGASIVLPVPGRVPGRYSSRLRYFPAVLAGAEAGIFLGFSGLRMSQSADLAVSTAGKLCC